MTFVEISRHQWVDLSGRIFPDNIKQVVPGTRQNSFILIIFILGVEKDLSNFRSNFFLHYHVHIYFILKRICKYLVFGILHHKGR